MSDSPKKGLGRGLSALMGEVAAPLSETAVRGLRNLPTASLMPGRFQPRRRFDETAIAELAASLRTQGMLQPILVRRHPERGDAYEIVAGERRWRAAQVAGLHEVPALVRALSDAEAIEVALVENLQREDLGPLEEADAYRRLMDEFEHTQEELAEHLGKSRSQVANALRLLTLPDPVKAMLEQGELSAGHARALLVAADPLALAKKIVAEELSVREAEALVRKESAAAKRKRARKGAPARGDVNVRALERELSATLGLAAKIKVKGKGGELVLRYKDLDQLDDLLKKLGQGKR